MLKERKKRDSKLKKRKRNRKKDSLEGCLGEIRKSDEGIGSEYTVYKDNNHHLTINMVFKLTI